MLEILRPLPRCLKKVWAGGLLSEWWGQGAGVGEVWIVSDVAGSSSPLATGAELREAVAQDPEAILGPRLLAEQQARDEEPRFPYLIKLVDIGPPISVQLHPDGATARALGDGPKGKAEAWLTLATREDAQVYAGVSLSLIHI